MTLRAVPSVTLFRRNLLGWTHRIELASVCGVDGSSGLDKNRNISPLRTPPDMRTYDVLVLTSSTQNTTEAVPLQLNAEQFSRLHCEGRILSARKLSFL
jgi:hypothetical protein